MQSRLILMVLVGAAASAAACTTSATPARHAAAAPGPAQAGSALSRAAAAMQGASGYRFVGVVRSGAARTTVQGEYQAPDRIHEVITTPGGTTVEVVFIGGQAYAKGPGGWSKPAASSVLRQGDPRAAFAVLGQARGVTGTDSLAFDLPAAALAGLVSGGQPPAGGHGVATLSAGGIAHLGFTFRENGTPVDVSLDYRDIGTAPPVRAPIV